MTDTKVDKPKVECPLCKKMCVLNKDGTLRTHGFRTAYGDYREGCEASQYHLDEAEKMRAKRDGDQELPETNDSVPVQDQVCDYVQRRKQVGIQRYGTPLQAHNGRDALRDAFEEAVDLVQYLAQLIIERDGKLP
jgi:hypothetical protein